MTKDDKGLMPILRVASQALTHPFGDDRTVKQAFPKAIPAREADPFLMCDYFHQTLTEQEVQQFGLLSSRSRTTSLDDDESDFYPVDWHPHRGFDICTYMKAGVGKHADSLGNRITYDTPGMQWMSTGSGVYHAEGDGQAKVGDVVEGFQIWINVPADQKMNDPRYGTVPKDEMPLLEVPSSAGHKEEEEVVKVDGRKVTARILAGKNPFAATNDTKKEEDDGGPFETVQPVQMVDIEIGPGQETHFHVDTGLDTTVLYVYDGSLESVNGEHSTMKTGNVILLDATHAELRGVHVKASNNNNDNGGAKMMLFAGKKLKQPIAWHGPIVMNTQQEIRQTIMELQSGNFPPVRVDWDYRRLAAKPKDDEL